MAFAARTAGSVRVPPAGGLYGVRCANGWLCAGSARQASGSFSSCAAGVRVKGLASPLTIPASGSLHAALHAVPSLLTSALRTARIRRPGSCRALADVLSARPGRRARLSLSDASVTPSPVITLFYKRLRCLTLLRINLRRLNPEFALVAMSLWEKIRDSWWGVGNQKRVAELDRHLHNR